MLRRPRSYSDSSQSLDVLAGVAGPYYQQVPFTGFGSFRRPASPWAPDLIISGNLVCGAAALSVGFTFDQVVYREFRMEAVPSFQSSGFELTSHSSFHERNGISFDLKGSTYHSGSPIT